MVRTRFEQGQKANTITTELKRILPKAAARCGI